MYQLKITKNTDALALQHFNNVKGRLLDAYSGGYPFSISGDIRSVPS